MKEKTLQNGFITLHRKVLDWYGAGHPNRLALWVRILLMANHEDKRFLFNGQPTLVSRGQFITGRKRLSISSGIPESTIERLLKEFEKDGNIEQQKTSRNRLITITKYHEYQSKNSPRTTGEQLANNPRTQTTMKQCNNATSNSGKLNDSINTLFSHFCSCVSKPTLKLTDDRKNLISAKLKDGYTEEQIKTAMDNFGKDDWDGRRKYFDLIYCIGKQKGKQDNMERWLHSEPVQKDTKKYLKPLV